LEFDFSGVGDAPGSVKDLERHKVPGLVIIEDDAGPVLIALDDGRVVGAFDGNLYAFALR
jgi:hypothetical protein